MRTFVIRMGLALGIGLAASAALGDSLVRAKGEFSTDFRELKYDPSRACVKPYRAFDADRIARQQFRSEAVEYVGCLKRTAQADSEVANDAIAEGYKTAVARFTAEVAGGN